MPADDWRAIAKLLWQPVAAANAASLERSAATETPSSPPASGAAASSMTDRRHSLLDALGARDVAASHQLAQRGVQLREDLNQLLWQLERFEAVSRCPILAITGQLNAGKSSLLASYLTPANRRRVLRGLTNAGGTHRYVLWLPSSWWHERELFETLVSHLTELVGEAPERLAEDPMTAARQYNGQVMAEHRLALDGKAGQSGRDAAPRPALDIPLVAYDEALDDLRLGLLDCPDIQTGFGARESTVTGDALASARHHSLARFGKLCSAFVVVSKLASLHDESLASILATLQQTMPGVPRLLAVNKLKARYGPTTVLDEARELIRRYEIQSVFVAYDFRSSRAAQRIPPAPPGMRIKPNAPIDLPIFFAIDRKHSESRSDNAEQVGYLHTLGDYLDAGTLSKETLRSLSMQLRSQTLACIEWFIENDRVRDRMQRDARQTIAKACYEVTAKRNDEGHEVGLRFHASPAVMGQITDSLYRTAPYWMRASLKVDRTAHRFQKTIIDSAARLKILNFMSSKVGRMTQKFRQGIGAEQVDNKALVDAVRSADAQGVFDPLNDQQLQTACEQAMQRFKSEEQNRLDQDQQEQLDRWSRKVWDEMGIKKKLRVSMQPLAVVTAPFVAVILLPFDFGGSAVMVFASVSELLAAAGLVTVLGPTLIRELESIVSDEIPWQQMSDLFALMCDSLGVERPGKDGQPTIDYRGEAVRLRQSETRDGPRQIIGGLPEWTPPPQHLDAVWQATGERSPPARSPSV